jgi:hypothetical protein
MKFVHWDLDGCMQEASLAVSSPLLCLYGRSQELTALLHLLLYMLGNFTVNQQTHLSYSSELLESIGCLFGLGLRLGTAGWTKAPLCLFSSQKFASTPQLGIYITFDFFSLLFFFFYFLFGSTGV